MTSRVNAAICDAQFLFRDGLYLLLKEEGFDVPVSATKHDELIECVGNLSGNMLILLSEDNFSQSLVDTISKLHAVKPQAKIVVILQDYDEASRLCLERLGVNGILSKSIARNVLILSIELVMLGEHVFSASYFQAPRAVRAESNAAALVPAGQTVSVPSCASLPLVEPISDTFHVPVEKDCTSGLSFDETGALKIQPVEPVLASPSVPDDTIQEEPSMAADADASMVPLAPAHAADQSLKDILVKRDTLSARETELLLCLVDGASNKVIARQCDITEATVKVHLKAILRKIKVQNRTQAAVWMMERIANARDDPTRASPDINPLHNRRSTDQVHGGRFRAADKSPALLSSLSRAPIHDAATYVEHRY